MSDIVVPKDLRAKCPLCNGVGHKERNSYSQSGTLRMGSCHNCKGRGWVWALDQEEMAQRIAQAEERVKTMREALENLMAKLRVVIPIADNYIAFQTIRSGRQYDGPQIVEEMKAADAALKGGE